jgi:hypothetical protein
MNGPKVVCCACGKECEIFSPFCKACQKLYLPEHKPTPEAPPPTPEELEKAGQQRLIP